MYAFAVAAFWFAVFAVSFLRDRRLFKNGIFLVLTLMFAGIGMIFVVDAFNDTAARWLVLAVLAVIPLAIAVLAVFLVVNGITMLRREGRRPKNLLSGGQGPDEDVPESHAMASYLIARGVPDDRILCEDRSTTTLENLTFSRELMVARTPKYRCLIVTNNFHAFRAAMTARKAKVNGQVIGSPTAAYYWPTATIREFVAILFGHPYLNGGSCLLIAAGAIMQHV